MIDRHRTPRATRKIAYIVVWAALLTYVQLSYDSTETSDSEAIRSILFGLVSLLALPVSLIVLGVLMGIVALAQLFDAAVLDALNGSVLASREGFRLQFFLWWLLMFIASYWQWFHLFPLVAASIKRRMRRNRAEPPEATPT